MHNELADHSDRIVRASHPVPNYLLSGKCPLYIQANTSNRSTEKSLFQILLLYRYKIKHSTFFLDPENDRIYNERIQKILSDAVPFLLRDVFEKESFMTFDPAVLPQLLTLIDENVLAKVQMVLLLISLVLSLMQCYFGYRFLKFWIAVLGFILGAVAGVAVSVGFFGIDTWYPWAIGLAAGALLSFLAYKLYLAGVFVFSGFTASSAVYAVTELPAVRTFLEGLNGETTQRIIVIALCVIAFVVTGILSVKFAKPFIIVVTSLSGCLLASRTLVQLIPSMEMHPEYQMIAAAALGVSGILLQHLMILGKK